MWLKVHHHTRSQQCNAKHQHPEKQVILSGLAMMAVIVAVTLRFKAHLMIRHGMAFTPSYLGIRLMSTDGLMLQTSGTM